MDNKTKYHQLRTVLTVFGFLALSFSVFGQNNKASLTNENSTPEDSVVSLLCGSWTNDGHVVRIEECGKIHSKKNGAKEFEFMCYYSLNEAGDIIRFKECAREADNGEYQILSISDKKIDLAVKKPDEDDHVVSLMRMKEIEHVELDEYKKAKAEVKKMLKEEFLSDSSKVVDAEPLDRIDRSDMLDVIVMKYGSPEDVVNQIFDAAKSGNLENLSGLCDPSGDGDNDTKDICTILDYPQNHRDYFIEYFSKGRITSQAVITDDKATLDFLCGPDGDKKETMNLVKKDGKWYLSSF